MKLRRRAEFTRVYDHGTRYRGRLMTCFALPNEVGSPRLGIAASQKIGNAVVRNRAKRLVRELFRGRKPLTGIDIVVIPRREMVDAPWRNIEADYRAALERFEKLLKPGLCPRLALAAIRGYQLLIRPLLTGSCRYLPTCSEYAAEAIVTYGALGAAGWASSACFAATLSVARVWIRSLS